MTDQPQMIFVNLPVSDVEASQAFFEALGFHANPRFSDDTAKCIVVSDTIYMMILNKEKFAGFAPRPVADTQAVTAALICLSRNSREAVDQITERAVQAGGTDNDKVQDYGFMYGRSFCDPDGNVFEVMWMDMAAAQGAAETAAAT
ncbi:VOC family protein [Paracoccus beibuensis]|uniref:VOC family protein n=1 Tax=Paracoccus beibuensis TaxID=547602 RepID=UPI00223EBB71|nr:VOC family protein [Paracoccus beibuensis]